jgi:hypothetical protein
MSNWSRVISTNIKEYVQGEEVNILRNRKFLAMLKERGRMSFNHSGTSLNWRVRFRRGTMQGFALGDTLTFPQIDKWKSADLPWRGYAASEGMTQMEMLQNKGMTAIVKVYANMAKVMLDDMGENFAEECYVDGNAASNGKRFHGLESAFSSSGVTRPFVADPNDTYAGLSCAMAGYGGNWSGSWPDGRGDPQYDFWSPLLVNYTDSNANAWEATTKTWKNTCLEALSYGIMAGQRNKSKTGMVDTVFLERNLYRQAVDRHRETQRIVYQPNSSNSTLVKLGFGDVFSWDGADVTWEFGMPTATGYGVNFNDVECNSLQSKLFEAEGPDYDIASSSYRFALKCYGNFRFCPRNLIKWYSYS